MTEKQFRSNSEHRPHSGYLSGTRTVFLYSIGVVTPSALLAPLDADGAACAARGKERIDLTHIDQSFVTGSCWRMRMLCVSCEFVYMVPSIAMLAEMLLPLSVCVSIVLPS